MSKWTSCSLGDLGEVVGGATPSTRQPECYTGGTIAWIRPKDLAGFQGRFISKGSQMITEEGYASCSTQLMPKYSILFSSRAPIGYVAIAANPLCTSQGFKSIVSGENTDYLFLYYLLKYHTPHIQHMSSETTLKAISGSRMRNVKVMVPSSKREQEKIASILASLDERIENNQQINKNLSG